MAFDAPDYFNRYAEREAHEGRQRVIFHEDFSATKRHFTHLILTAGTYTRSFDYAHSGEASGKFTPGGADGNGSGFRQCVGLPYTGIITLDAWFTPVIGVGNVKIRFVLRRYSGTTKDEIWIEYKTSTKAWYHYPDLVTPTKISNSDQEFDLLYGTWNHCVISVDLENLHGIILQSNELLLDITDLSLNIQAWGATYQYCTCDIIIYSDGATTNPNVYLDDILLIEG